MRFNPIKILQFFILCLIWLYQKTISPDHGWFRSRFPHGYCRFYPSCSQYAKEVIVKRGLLVGSLKAGYRILRCNPWSKGGVDLPH
ncbi:MAG TPA: membrane protein insertion efficiency factor YidD [Patescibacteria group bacterium]|nr:membrane protein insertion efficiency factor YidD [Patescibacteria group bacterium]